MALALDAAQIGVWEFDLRAARVTWSEGLERIHGLTPGTFGGTYEDYQRDIHPEDRDRVLATISRSLQGADHQLEYRIIRPDGEIRWLNARGRMLRDERGEPVRMVGVCADVTEQRRAEQAARLHERWMSTVLHSIGDAVIATDADGLVTLMNPVAEALSGRRLDEVRGRPLDEVIPLVREDTREPVENPVAKVLRENAIVGLANHTVLIRPDGSELPIDDSAAPIRDDAGGIVGVVMVFHDVSARRKEEQRRAFAASATARLASSIDYQETLQTAARLAVPHIADWCGIDLLSPEGALERLAVAHVDPSKVELARALQERYPADLDAPHGVGKVLRTGQSELIPDIPDALLVQLARDPEHLEMIRQLGLRSAMVVPIRLHGVTLGAITFVSSDGSAQLDEDDLRLAEEFAHSAAIAIQNARLYDQVQQALRSREELLAVVSHDLRNPLNVMMMRAAVLLRRLPDDEASAAVRSDVEAIHRAGRRMERLIRDLLDFARIRAGRLPVDPARHDAGELLAHAAEALAPLASARGISVVREGEVDGIGLWCDRERMLQVFENLGGNAVRFTPEGGRITLGAERRGDTLSFTVTDTGPGIPEDLRPHLFDRYWQADDRSQEGLGLGLFISKGIVDAHAGSLAVEDAPGGGARFRFTVPIRDT